MQAATYAGPLRVRVLSDGYGRPILWVLWVFEAERLYWCFGVN